jgi:hypothetical protein
MEKKWRAENERIMREFPSDHDPVMLAAPAQEMEATPGARPGEQPPP